MRRDGLARRLGRLEAARPMRPTAPPLDFSRFTDEEIEFLADLGERRQTPDGRWDVAAMTQDERLAVAAVLERAGVP